LNLDNNPIKVLDPLKYTRTLYRRNRLFLYTVLVLECIFPIPSVLCHFTFGDYLS